ncbi:hypothetical protein SAY87_007352 [Trapa incisa]|uniref:Chromatin remodeling protein SHL-like n=1 Tax=Trapa incisa TaxID=236973 RepID=A0AAN7K4A3_9MYRT|nr:hypothetical protein SAY87_007352 [Trapa incisa]
MAKAKAPRRTLESYTVKPSNKIIRGEFPPSSPSLSIFHPFPSLSPAKKRVSFLPSRAAASAGDCVLMRPSDPSKLSYVAMIEQIESDPRGANVKVHVRWYYRPEESIGGRRQFHGSKEVFLSDHFDVQSADTIEGKCTVHTFKSYTKLDAVGNDDFFCRFEYNSSTGAFNPDRVAVYCKCEMPYNPDELMVQCEGCNDWFHPACINMTAEEAKRLDHFFCEICSTEGKKKLQNSHTPRQSDTKVDTKRRRM